MARLGLAWRTFWRVLRDGDFARLAAGVAPKEEPVVKEVVRQVESGRSEALTLLEVLQREGRLVDFLQEDVGAYSDAQIGAAVRDIHRDCRAAVERMFALRAVMEQSEGTMVQVNGEGGTVRLTGNVVGQAPFQGLLRHKGWKATKLQLPAWTGGEPARQVVAAAEVEVLEVV